MPHSTVRKLLATSLAAFFALTAPPLAWCTLAAAGQSAPPSLAELARKEAERRKTSKEAKAKKVITTKDMPESARRPASTPAAEPVAEGSSIHAAPAPATGSDQKPATGAATAPADDKAEASWRNRMTLAREALRRNEVFLQALQTRVNALTVDYANSDANQQIKVRESQAKALEEMEKVKADIEQSKKQISDIEEEARRAGVPPGWLR